MYLSPTCNSLSTMEFEHKTPLMTKKILRIIRAILYIVKKELSKNIPWFELQSMLKRSTKIAGKAIGNLILDHQTLTCRRNDISTTFIAPIEYEFSCSNTPLFHPKRKNNHHRYAAGNGGLHRRKNKDYGVTVDYVRKAFDGFNCGDAVGVTVEAEKSPLTMLFGRSSNVRQLRVTDSPFPVSNTEEEDVIQVDKAAEEFIKNFYKELKQQKHRATVEPPSPVGYRRWGELR